MAFAILVNVALFLSSLQTSTIFAQSSQEGVNAVSNKVNSGGNGSDWDKFVPPKT